MGRARMESEDENSCLSAAAPPELVVKTVEYLESDYGLFTWPCAPILAYHVYTQRGLLKGSHVLELGAGTAVPGITAAKLGAQVTLTDRADNLHLMDTLKHSCALNELSASQVKFLPLSWGIFSPDLLSLGQQDFILASDCFYDSNDFEDILATVSYLLSKNPHCKFWTSYQERSSNRSLIPLLRRWGLKRESLSVAAALSGATSIHIQGPSPTKLDTDHTIHLWEVTQQ